MTDLFIIAWIVLCLYGIKYCKGNSNFYEDYLSKDSTLVLKGIFTIAIILHHLSQRFEPLPKLFSYFELVGPWSVMIFFFISGFGLMYNHIHKEGYDKGFLIKRFKTIVPLYIIAIVLYWITYEIVGDHQSISSVLYSIIDGSPMVIHSWYIIVILIFYIIFYILMKLFKKNRLAILLTSILICTLWIIVRPLLGYGFWWSVSIYSLPLGMLWALYKTQIDIFVHKHYWIILSIFTILFILSWKFTFNNRILYYLFNYGDHYRQSIIFPILVMIASMKFKSNSSILKYFGSISLDLYLFHGLFSNLIFLNTSLPQTNPMLYCFLSLVLSIILASIIHYVYKITIHQPSWWFFSFGHSPTQQLPLEEAVWSARAAYLFNLKGSSNSSSICSAS